jgi:hypothetical protein
MKNSSSTTSEANKNITTPTIDPQSPRSNKKGKSPVSLTTIQNPANRSRSSQSENMKSNGKMKAQVIISDGKMKAQIITSDGKKKEVPPKTDEKKKGQSPKSDGKRRTSHLILP